MAGRKSATVAVKSAPSCRCATPCWAPTATAAARRANLRRHFEGDRFHVAQPAIAALAADGKMTAKDVAGAIKLYQIDAEKPNPVGV